MVIHSRGFRLLHDDDVMSRSRASQPPSRSDASEKPSGPALRDDLKRVTDYWEPSFDVPPTNRSCGKQRPETEHATDEPAMGPASLRHGDGQRADRRRTDEELNCEGVALKKHTLALSRWLLPDARYTCG